MNRKIAIAAIVGGLTHMASFLRGQEREAPTRTLSKDTSGLTPEIVQDLQKQVAELTRRVEVLEQVNANSMGFSRVGSDYVFQPPSGNVVIKGSSRVQIQGNAIDVDAAATLSQKASVIHIN